MPLAHQARCKRQATEDLRYKIKIQAFWKYLGSDNRFQQKMCILSIIMYIVQHTTITCIYIDIVE